MITPKYLIGCCFYIELMLIKVIKVKNKQSATIGILSIGLNFKNQFVVCHNFLMLGLDISDITIITVNGIDYRIALFLILANLAQFIC